VAALTSAPAARTALHHAVRHNQVLFAKMLLQQGADPEAQNNVR
jgi:ankyrin repeat protein